MPVHRSLAEINKSEFSVGSTSIPYLFLGAVSHPLFGVDERNSEHGELEGSELNAGIMWGSYLAGSRRSRLKKTHWGEMWPAAPPRSFSQRSIARTLDCLFLQVLRNSEYGFDSNCVAPRQQSLSVASATQELSFCLKFRLLILCYFCFQIWLIIGLSCSENRNAVGKQMFSTLHSSRNSFNLITECKSCIHSIFPLESTLFVKWQNFFRGSPLITHP